MEIKEIRYCPKCRRVMDVQRAVNWQLYRCPKCDIEISEGIFLEVPKIVKWNGKELKEGDKNDDDNN